MINAVYRLIAPRQFRLDFIEETLGEMEVLIKPTYLSVCAADQRYYNGSRGMDVLAKKLPMALIHEGVGEVIYDPRNKYEIGSKVVMVPNTPVDTNSRIRENYQPTAAFRASGYDGFMQSLVVMRRDRIIPYQTIPDQVASLLELTSVVMNAVDTFERHAIMPKTRIGIWGDGNLGFISALVLKERYKDAKICLFGLTNEKMEYFPFVDEFYTVDAIPDSLAVDHAFECVGGRGSEVAINQIIDYITPQGSINLMGVSEKNVAINTRMVLEKGLQLLGNSRSGYEDFANSVDFLEKSEYACGHMNQLISEVIEVKSIKDMYAAFERSFLNEFKTIMKWNI